VILHISDCLPVGGALADIFLDPGRTLAHKLFVGPCHRSKGYTPDDEQRRRKTFNSECAAYEIIQRNPALTRHVPKFFTRSTVTDVIDEQGQSVRDQYLIDCCYAMEFIGGSADAKIGACRAAYPHISSAEQAFKHAGVLYIEDSGEGEH
jgi:hypothetical protein